ncbi:MAG: 50S ribosomal protein L32e [Candidatus Methanomethylicia archaeon]
MKWWSKTVKRYFKLREKLNSKRPKFIVMDSWRLKRLPDGWRRPRGNENKIRICKKGYPIRVKVGYRGPKIIRGYHPSGFRPVIVHNEEELLKINPKREAAIIAHTVGFRKRSMIESKAKELGIRILNSVNTESSKVGS